MSASSDTDTSNTTPNPELNHNPNPSQLETDRAEAAVVVQLAFRRTKKLRLVRTKLAALEEHLRYVLHTLRELESGTSFESATNQLLRNERFYQALMAFLTTLPKDPNLKSNYQAARNFRIISTALIVAKHPREVLVQEDGAAYTQEGLDCRAASATLLNCMRRLCEAVLKTVR
jgi:hypothetical protein